MRTLGPWLLSLCASVGGCQGSNPAFDRGARTPDGGALAGDAGADASGGARGGADAGGAAGGGGAPAPDAAAPLEDGRAPLDAAVALGPPDAADSPEGGAAPSDAAVALAPPDAADAPEGGAAPSDAAVVLADAGSTSPPGLVAHFAMDEGAGTNVTDALGGPALALRMPATWTAGASGAAGDRALSFSGGRAGTDPAGAGAAIGGLRKAITIAMWLWWSEPRAGDSVLLVHGFRNWDLRLGPSSFPRACFTSGDGAFIGCGNAEIPTRRWVHLAVTWDGAAVRQYVDGVDHRPEGLPFSGPLPSSAADPIQVGAWGETGDPLIGAIDDLRLYARALSGAEIARLAGK